MLQKKDFPALTGIRFIAASMVFLFHYADNLTADKNSFAHIILSRLNIGVNLFFVLSGFLITYRYYDMSLSLKTFRLYLTKRIARIFPLYWLLLAIQLLLLFHSNKISDIGWQVFLNVTLLKGLSATYCLSGIAQAWSLTVEEMFYLFAPLSFYFIRAKKFFLLQIPVLIAIGYVAVSVFSKYPFKGFFESIDFMFFSTFFGRCFEFFVGIYIALRIINKSPVSGFKHFTLCGSALFFILLLALCFYTHQMSATHQHGGLSVVVLLFNFLIPAAIGIFFYGLLVEQTWFKRLVSADWMILLGKSSYAFYLLHIGMIAEVIYFHITANILLLYILLQLLSVVAYKAFEKPVYFFILRKFAGQKNKISPYLNG